MRGLEPRASWPPSRHSTKLSYTPADTAIILPAGREVNAMMLSQDTERLSRLVQLLPKLWDWYRANARALPWREPSTSPYAVWVSEIMLQQTQVATAAPFFERWMERFPTVRDLANAPLDEVLRYWAGLGYYARARNLHLAAKNLLASCDGKLPSDVKALLRLPGVGRYTAGAIASLAYGIPAAVVDANVARVLCRIFGVDGIPSKAATARRLAALAEALVPPDAPGLHNQAMMELGALVCSPSDPACGRCPLRDACHAAQTESPTDWPRRPAARRQVRTAHASAALFRSDGSVLLVRRAPHGLWGGMWELPRRECAAGEAPVHTAERALREVVGLRATIGAELHTVRHAVMHYAITLHVLRASEPEGDASLLDCLEVRWATPRQALELPVASPQRQALERLAAMQHLAG